MTLAQALVVLLVVIGAWFDLRTRRIPNSLTLPMTVAGLVLSSAMAAPPSGWSSLLALIGVLAVGVPASAAGLLGAGDVKLIGGVAALLGPRLLVESLLWTAVVGAVVAMSVLAARRTLLPFLRRFFVVGYGRLRWGTAEPVIDGPGHSIALGAVIAAGTIAAITSAQLGFGWVR